MCSRGGLSGPNHTGKREDVDPRRTTVLQSVRARFHRGAGGIDIVDQQDRLSLDFGGSPQGERALNIPVPGPTREAALTWRISVPAQGIRYDGKTSYARHRPRQVKRLIVSPPDQAARTAERGRQHPPTARVRRRRGISKRRRHLHIASDPRV